MNIKLESNQLNVPGRRKPYVMAHRGNRILCPENTIASFLQAIDDGADILETDLHLSADGVFMCIHDETLDRTTNTIGKVADKTLKELKTFSASYGRPEFKNETIPTLSELGNILPPDVALALELKTDRFLEDDVCAKLANELSSLGIRQSHFCNFIFERSGKKRSKNRAGYSRRLDNPIWFSPRRGNANSRPFLAALVDKSFLYPNIA